MESRKDFKWSVLAVSAVSLLLVFVGVFVCVRVSDGLWNNMNLPIVLIVTYAVALMVAVMYIALSNMKCSECDCGKPKAEPEPVVEEPVKKTRKPRTPKVEEIHA